MSRFAVRLLTPLCVPAAVLAACSPAGDDSTPAADDAAPVALSAQSAAPPAPSATGAGMTGQVSDLKGDVSGLNIRITDMGTIIDLAADALFEFDQAVLTPAAEAQLRKAAEVIRQAPPGPIQVVGHTDAKGDDAYNQRLSEARARTVADWFGQQVGVRQRDFTVLGKGETAPIAPNQADGGQDDPAGRAKNRRVEVVLPR